MANLDRLTTSGAWNFLGMSVVRNDQGQIGVTLKNTPQMRQMHGTMHGGLIATVLDAAGGVAISETLSEGYGVTTVEIKVNYLLPVKTDLTAYAEIARKGSKLATAIVKGYDEDHNLVAIATGTYRIVRLS